MRVLLVNDLSPQDPAAGGTERHLERLAAALTAAGDQVELCAGEVAHHGAAAVRDLFDPSARALVARRARAMRADVVHHHQVLRALSVAVLGVPRGTPSVLTVLDARLLGSPDPDTGTARRVLDRVAGPAMRLWVRRQVPVVLAVSETLAGGLRAAGFTDVRVVASPVAEERRAGALPSAGNDLVFAGRLSADKGLPELLAAWGLVAAAYPNARCVVAGAGPLAPRLAAVPGVRAVGQLPDAALADLFAGARAVVVPSRTDLRPEGLPLVALEAMSHGRPLVVTDDGGLADLVPDCALGVPPGDVPALAAALADLLTDGPLADRLGAAGRERSAANRPAAVAAEHHRVYASLLSRE